MTEELQKTRAALNIAEEKLTAAKDTYDRTIIRAPVDGVVVGLNAHTIGGVIAPGDTMMEIVPFKDKTGYMLTIHQ